MLKCKQAIIHSIGGIYGAIRKNPENAAFFPWMLFFKRIANLILFHLQAYPFHNFLVCFLDAAKVPAETVFVKLFMCTHIPKPACIG